MAVGDGVILVGILLALRTHSPHIGHELRYVSVRVGVRGEFGVVVGVVGVGAGLGFYSPFERTFNAGNSVVQKFPAWWPVTVYKTYRGLRRG